MYTDKKSKVLIVVPNDKLGGAEQHLKNIASSLLLSGCSIDVYFLKKETSFEWRGMDGNINLFFTKRDTEKMGVISVLIMLLRINIKRREFDYIFTSHVHINSFIGILISLGILKKKFFIGRESTSVFKRFKGLKLLIFKVLYKVGYNKLDLLICQTKYMKNQLEEGLPKLASKINIQVIPNPINLDNITIDALDFDLLQENYIVSAGRLIPEKGFDILIKSFAKFADNFRDFKLIILGEGDQRDKLEGLVRDLNLDGRVKLLGFKNNVYTYFKYAKCCVVSSRIEGFPNVLLQMMSQNDTIVSTLCAGGIDEIPNIYTTEINNVDFLAAEMARSVINNNSNNRKIFDNFLKERSVPGFIEKVNLYLKG
jgi:glycosyltransferase involved in cell wall biosynthesis